MSFPEFAIYLQQLDVGEYSGFCFTLPERYIGRGDIQIYVEYGAPNVEGMIAYNAWSQFAGQAIRSLAHVGAVGGSDKDATVEDIMNDLNNSDEFYGMLHFLIEQYGR